MASERANLAARTFRRKRDVDQYWRSVRAVPGRLRRSKRDEERYCLGLYLLALATHELIKFPIRVEEGESPDFMLTASGRTTGLEITKATEPWLQREMTQMEVEYEHRKSASPAGIRPDPVATILSQGGWTDGQAEEEWRRQVQAAIARKLPKIERFRPASRHDLLVYDDTPLPAVERGKALAGLRPWLRATKQANRGLGRISIIVSLDVLFDTGRDLRFLPFIDWSTPEHFEDFGERVEFVGRKAVTSTIRGRTQAGMPVYSMDSRGRLVKQMPDGRRLEVALARDGSEMVIGEI